MAKKKQRKIYCKDTGETANTYKAYLKTKHWRRFRKKIYERYNHKCARCRKEIPLGKGNVHHKTYEHIGHEWIKDVIFLCIDCHKLVHEREKKTKKRKK